MLDTDENGGKTNPHFSLRVPAVASVTKKIQEEILVG